MFLPPEVQIENPPGRFGAYSFALCCLQDSLPIGQHLLAPSLSLRAVRELLSFSAMEPQPQDISDLQATIELLHGCKSSYCRTQLVKEKLDGHPDWDGLVKVFDLFGHPSAECCFAWSRREEGALKPVVVLKSSAVDSPESAVRMYRKS